MRLAFHDDVLSDLMFTLDSPLTFPYGNFDDTASFGIDSFKLGLSNRDIVFYEVYFTQSAALLWQ